MLSAIFAGNNFGFKWYFITEPKFLQIYPQLSEIDLYAIGASTVVQWTIMMITLKSIAIWFIKHVFDLCSFSN